MKKQTVTILVIAGVLILFCCCIVIGGLIAYRYKNQSGTTTTVQNTPHIVVITATTQQQSATQEAQQANPGDYQYAIDVGHELLDCGEKIGEFNDLAVQLNENINLVFDKDYQNQVNASIDQIEQYCTDISKDEGVPPQYEDANQQLELADQAMAAFVENMRTGIDTLNVDDISQALQDLADAGTYYQQAKTLMQN